MKSNFRRKNNIAAVWVAILMSIGALGAGCEGILPGGGDKPDPKEQAREDSLRVASTIRYGDPNKIITDKNGNPIPGPDGGTLRASDIPTNPNMKFTIRDSIASMARTLGLEIPKDNGILYGILTGDKQYYIEFNKYAIFYDYRFEDKSMGDWGSLSEQECTIKKYSNGEIIENSAGVGEWYGKPAILVGLANHDPILPVYINTPKGIEIYDYGSKKLIGYLEKSDKPDTYIRTTYEYERTKFGNILGEEPIGITVEEVPAGFIFVEQPEDDPDSVLGNLG
ncbi:MAG: Ig-like domain-containing protein [Dysgonamonadaceae bacterium]|jgi:hypothetical protein|nr:Ig-like domain-containing protein [Dysgonamonadaceae bacterium]